MVSLLMEAPNDYPTCCFTDADDGSEVTVTFPVAWIDALEGELLGSAHQRLIDAGFELTGSMERFPWEANPCPRCPNAGTHSLFASGDARSFWCQKLQARVDDYKLRGPESITVTSTADLRKMKRWIPLKGKKPARNFPGKSVPLGTGISSHKEGKQSKCGGFQDGISAEEFVRIGGVCRNHVIKSKKKREPIPYYTSFGWHDCGQLEAQGFDPEQLAFCCAYSDAPSVVIVDLDIGHNMEDPKQPPTAEELAERGPVRDGLMEQLAALGCPTGPSGNPNSRRAAFAVTELDIFGGKRVWKHPTGMACELYGPGAKSHILIYGLDGDLPTLTAETLAKVLLGLGFTPPAPKANKFEIRGSKGLASFMVVAEREGWDLAFNTMSKTAFCDGVEQDDVWTHIARAHLELNYLLIQTRQTPTGGDFEQITKFAVNEKLIRSWGFETALLRNSYHPVQDWLNSQPAWDGKPRIDGLLTKCLGASVEGDDSGELVRTASSDIIMGLVNRAFEPGCAWPRITILWGKQGCGKSSLLESLLPASLDLYYESPTFPLSDEELFDHARSKWLIEFSDPSTRRAEAEAAKTFVSRKAYSYRHKYDGRSTNHPYNFHMVMTGNEGGNTLIPVDASGYRRYLSVDCQRVMSYEEMKAYTDSERGQIWAEALYRYRNGERFAEIPETLHAIRDAASQAKAGNGSLDGFFEHVEGAMQAQVRGGQQATGFSLHELGKL